MDITITKNVETSRLTLAIAGHMDTTTAFALEAELKQNISGIEELVPDFAALECLFSAGLRVLLSAQSG